MISGGIHKLCAQDYKEAFPKALDKLLVSIRDLYDRHTPISLLKVTEDSSGPVEARPFLPA
jgi:hypothetical protein